MFKLYMGLDLAPDQLKEYEALGCFFNNLESAQKHLLTFPLSTTEIFEIIANDEAYGFIVL